jgi:hypothetical protein
MRCRCSISDCTSPAPAEAQAAKRQKREQGDQLYAEYVLGFTTLAAGEASASQVLDAYRLRWQIELTFSSLW